MSRWSFVMKITRNLVSVEPSKPMDLPHTRSTIPLWDNQKLQSIGVLVRARNFLVFQVRWKLWWVVVPMWLCQEITFRLNGWMHGMLMHVDACWCRVMWNPSLKNPPKSWPLVRNNQCQWLHFIWSHCISFISRSNKSPVQEIWKRHHDELNEKRAKVKNTLSQLTLLAGFWLKFSPSPFSSDWRNLSPLFREKTKHAKRRETSSRTKTRSRAISSPCWRTGRWLSLKFDPFPPPTHSISFDFYQTHTLTLVDATEAGLHDQPSGEIGIFVFAELGLSLSFCSVQTKSKWRNKSCTSPLWQRNPSNNFPT